MSEQLQKTPLYEWHKSAGARLVEFGRYEMPLWYSSIKDEHLSVIRYAGLFDTSHMAVISLTGPDSRHLLQRCFTRDLSSCLRGNSGPLENGRIVYGAFLNGRGECIDDAIVYQISANEYLTVVNSGMAGEIISHLTANRGNLNPEIVDLTGKLGKVDIQGPRSLKIISRIVKDPEKVFERMPYFSFKGHFDKVSSSSNEIISKDGIPFLLSRSGYTGEFGFEIFVRARFLTDLWKQIIEAGNDFNLCPCGLASRDSLRTGALLPLSHQDIGGWLYLNHPWVFALPYNEKRDGFTKDFIGASALRVETEAEHTMAFLGDNLKKIDTHGAVVSELDGTVIGKVLTCVTDMSISRHEGKVFCITSPGRPDGFKARGLSCGFVKVGKRLNQGDRIILKDPRRSIEVTIVEDIRPDRTARLHLKEFK